MHTFEKKDTKLKCNHCGCYFDEYDGIVKSKVDEKKIFCCEYCKTMWEQNNVGV